MASHVKTSRKSGRWSHPATGKKAILATSEIVCEFIFNEKVKYLHRVAPGICLGKMPGKICQQFSGKLKHEDLSVVSCRSAIKAYFSIFRPKYQIPPFVYALSVPLGVISNFCNANKPLEALLATSKKRLFSLPFYWST